MNITFDIAEDELQVFLAETDELLQSLDAGFVNLERRQDDPELLQVLFRAAHTLKGSSGMIGHKRMTNLTHVLETLMDGLRKRTLTVTPKLIDACLQTLDALRLLRNEVAEGEQSEVNIEALVDQLSALSNTITLPPVAPAPSPEVVIEKRIEPMMPAKAMLGKNGKKARSNGHSKSRPQTTKAVKNSREVPAQTSTPASPAQSQVIAVCASISADSIASAARAFQMLLALQELGEIKDSQPSQAEIETAMPVRYFRANIVSSKSKEEIRQAMQNISEVDRVAIGDDEIAQLDEVAAPVPVAAQAPAASPSDQSEQEPDQLGEMLVTTGYITHFQLQSALKRQQELRQSGRKSLIGQVLMDMGLVRQEILSQITAQQNSSLRDNLEHQRQYTEKTVRTSVERLDSLLNLVGELITDRNRLNQIRSDFEFRFRGLEQTESLIETAIHIGRITDQLQSEVMRIRMMPIASVFNKFPRMVRDLARKVGKQVELVVRGEDTELDRSVIEEIGDPLIHLLRNAVDHGIELPVERGTAGKPERGTILLAARHEESRIILTIEDDGKGIDLEKLKAKAVQKNLITQAEADAFSQEEAINLIFRSGLSTSAEVSDISGRGVGMDIVRANIEKLNGSVQVETWPGSGSRFQITLPLTLAIVPALLVRSGAGTFAVPLASVVETLYVPQTQVRSINGRPVIQHRSHVLPIMSLNESLGFASKTDSNEGDRYIVAVRWNKQDMGLVVDELIGKQEMVIKSLGALVGDVHGVSGAAILGDGRVALIVDVPGVVQLANKQVNV